MTSLLVDPHGDDAALFAAYICQRETPTIVVPRPTVPPLEITRGAAALGCLSSIWKTEREHWAEHFALFTPVDHVYTPAITEEGHEEHNEISEIVVDLFRFSPITFYLTYGPRGQRDRNGTEVDVPNPTWIATKLRALSCFESQVEKESTRPWFYDLLDMREWIA